MSLDRKIFLVGMPGCGKSYFGNRLKEHTGLPLFDLDDVIVERQGQSISDIFSSLGEDAFRQIEREALTGLIKGHREFILATGGGTPCFFDNMNLMNSAGLTIFLKAPKELLVQRISENDERPLMIGNVEKKVAELLETRLPFYKKAFINMEDRDVDTLVPKIDQFFRS